MVEFTAIRMYPGIEFAHSHPIDRFLLSRSHSSHFQWYIQYHSLSHSLAAPLPRIDIRAVPAPSFFTLTNSSYWCWLFSLRSSYSFNSRSFFVTEKSSFQSFLSTQITMWINLILNHSRRPDTEVEDNDHDDQCLSTASSPSKGSKSTSNLRLFKLIQLYNLLTIFSYFIYRGLEDMKQRLRFLRRRHTDSSISSKPSVRPTPEQATKWAESFELLMSSRCK